MPDKFILTDDIEYNACQVKGQAIFSTKNNQIICNKIPDEYKDALITYCNSSNIFVPEVPVYLINSEKTMAIMIVPISLAFVDFMGDLYPHMNVGPQI